MISAGGFHLYSQREKVIGSQARRVVELTLEYKYDSDDKPQNLNGYKNDQGGAEYSNQGNQGQHGSTNSQQATFPINCDPDSQDNRQGFDNTINFL